MLEANSGKVAIILVNYNGYEDTIECIKSLKNIDYPNYEIIVVDNGSTNNSLDILRKYQSDNIILIDSKKNQGFSGGNNIGIKYAVSHNAEYVLLLNNDTLVEKDFLTRLVHCAIKYDERAVITSKILYAYDNNIIWYAGGKFNFTTGRVEHIGMGQVDKKQYEQEEKVSFASGCCMLIPVQIYKKIGLMDERYFLYCEDLDYCCRILNNGFEIIYAPKSVIYHKVNASTGKMSGAVTYYTVRNKLYIIKFYFNGMKKAIAYLYNYLQIAKRSISGEYSIPTVKRAIKDFKKQQYGRLKL